MPRIRLRVVWGFLDVMEIFCPRIRFNSVDFPALGAPRMATNPELKVVLGVKSLRIAHHRRSFRWKPKPVPFPVGFYWKKESIPPGIHTERFANDHLLFLLFGFGELVRFGQNKNRRSLVKFQPVDKIFFLDARCSSKI
jgi:hypothetical protein